MTATMATIRAVLKLARANMTVISGVTYLAAAVLSADGDVRMRLYFVGWAFVILTQFMTHFLGEVADARSDALNRYSTPVTGGSGVLPADESSVTMANFMGYSCGAGGAYILLNHLPAACVPVGLTIQVLAWAYSAQPVKLNHRCLGEIDAAIVTNILLPYFAAAVQGAVSGSFPFWDRKLDILVIPAFFIKISLFIVLNLADKRADWATGKVTCAVYLGEAVSSRIHLALVVTAYLSAVVVAYLQNIPAVLLFILPSIPYAWRITGTLNRGVPYNLSNILGPALLHSTFLAWGVLLHTLATTANGNGPRFYHAIVLAFFVISVENVRKGRRRAALLAKLGIPEYTPFFALSDVTDSGSDENQNKFSHTDVVVLGNSTEDFILAASLIIRGIDAVMVASQQGANYNNIDENRIWLTPAETSWLATLGVPKSYLRRLPCDGGRSVAIRDELTSYLQQQLKAQNVHMLHSYKRVHLSECERTESMVCDLESHKKKKKRTVVGRIAVGCSQFSQNYIDQLVLPRPKWCTPRCLNVAAGRVDAIKEAVELLAKFWTRPDGHLEAFYRVERRRMYAK